jgi:hypothetical protein
MPTNFKHILVSLAAWMSAAFISGCAEMSLKPQEIPNDDYIAIVDRIDNLDSRPDWLQESKPFTIDDGTVVSLGQTEIPADHRVDAAYRIAENNAEAEISGAIQRKLSFIFQNAEEGTGLDAAQVRFIGGEASRLISSSLVPGNRYWEKVVYVSQTGRQARYRVFATMEMPEEDFRRAILDALRRQAGKGGISADFAEKVDAHWDELTTPPEPKESATEEVPAPQEAGTVPN